MEMMYSVMAVMWVMDLSLRAFASVLITLVLLALPLLRPLSGQREIAIPLQEVWRIVVWVTVFTVLITMGVNRFIDGTPL